MFIFFPYIFDSGIVLCIDWAMAWALNVSSLIVEKSRAFYLTVFRPTRANPACCLVGTGTRGEWAKHEAACPA
jgi:hypothetical protein